MKRLVSRSAAAVVAAGMLGVLAVAPGCLDRPVAPQQPSTTKISTQLYRASKIDKIDLLFMIDNSASMADKQQILAKAVPDLVDRLVEPRCIDANSAEVAAGADGKCPSGSKREFEPVNDIHIGIISSSLGGHGADTCAPGPSGGYNERQEDMSHLIQRKCADAACTSFAAADTYMNKGFLYWDPKQKGPNKDGQNPGDSDRTTIKNKFQALVEGTGQDGCGFEASLEAWYRFLVDPAPFAKIVPTDCGTGQPADGGGCRGPDGNVDETVIAQRHDFLRPDSLLAVVMLSDENDCSVMEGGQGFLATQAYSGMSPFHLPRGTSACIDDPNSPQCTSCGVPGHEGDSECQKGGFNEDEDALNLRCYRQKQRFGMDFLYPIRRYAYGLTQTTFKPQPYCDNAGDPRCNEWDSAAFPSGVTNGDFNPVFCTEYEKDANGVDNRKLCKTVLRDPKLVFLAGIVGVPWQDIARNPNDLTKGYRPAEELSWTTTVYDNYNKGKADADKKSPAPGVTDKVSIWDHIVGKTGYADAENPSDTMARKVGGVEHYNPWFLQPDPAPSGFAQDPLMIESIDPRTGTNPATNSALAPESAGEPTANPVNGHEWTIAGKNDLQYACIFELPTPKQCVNADSCDCSTADKDGTNNPLCQSGSGYGTTQYRAKAYPGRRQLATLRGVEVLSSGQAIAASICPANTKTEGADYGYRPAIATIIERLRAVLAGTCWGQQLEPDANGEVPCFVFEATKMPEGSTTCPVCDTTKARSEADDTAKTALKGDTNFKENNLACICKINQAATGDPLKQCMSSTEDFPTSNGAPVNGWCYVDPSTNKDANGALVATCPADAKRMIRFVGDASPVSGSLTYLQCKGATFGSN